MYNFTLYRSLVLTDSTLTLYSLVISLIDYVGVRINTRTPDVL